MGNELAAVIAAVTALVVLAIERWMNRIVANRELRRRALEEWLSSLAAWVDEHRKDDQDQAATSLMQEYQQLTNRQILELRFKRPDKYVAWWMHEMVLALFDEESAEVRAAHRDQVLRDTGEALLQWHHGELKTRDFEIPYALRKEARTKERALPEVADGLNLSEFVKPQRMTIGREWHIAKLVSDPETGRPLMESLGGFIGKKNAVGGFGLVRMKLAWAMFHLGALKLNRSRTKWRLARLKRRHTKLQEKQAQANGQLLEAREELAEMQEKRQQQEKSKGSVHPQPHDSKPNS